MNNEVAASPKSRFRGDEWRAFDALPAALRRCLHEAVVNWDPRQCAWDLKRALKSGVPYDDAIARLVAIYRGADQDEVNLFAHRYWRRYDQATPHVRAGVSIQRYAGHR